jgi:hypothetical protein
LYKMNSLDCNILFTERVLTGDLQEINMSYSKQIIYLRSEPSLPTPHYVYGCLLARSIKRIMLHVCTLMIT